MLLLLLLLLQRSLESSHASLHYQSPARPMMPSNAVHPRAGL